MEFLGPDGSCPGVYPASLIVLRAMFILVIALTSKYDFSDSNTDLENDKSKSLGRLPFSFLYSNLCGS